jgi:UDP-2,4-diacetamido-2,4,6-trideoxy-beta-L-altropyranose hydrolase
MQVTFRSDVSIQIGTGHVMRCLTLADALRELGAHSTFVCRQQSGHLLNIIAERGYHVVELPNLETTTNCILDETAHANWLGADWLTDAQQTREALGDESVDWLVVDHYSLDHRWEDALRSHCQNIMVIDDLADRAHNCDVLLDQNLGRSAQDYDGLLKPQTAKFIGPQYALLRPEFAQLRNQSLAQRTQPQLKHLLITMGGVDKDNTTGGVLQALTACHLPPDLHITVVMGPHSPYLVEVTQQAMQMPWRTQVLVGVSAMAQLMLDSDLCIGAAGSTSWERCCLGLPTLLLALAENQLPGAKALEKAGAAMFVGNIQNLSQVFEEHIQNGGNLQLKSLALASSAVTDGLGAQRIVSAMLRDRLND